MALNLLRHPQTVGRFWPRKTVNKGTNRVPVSSLCDLTAYELPASVLCCQFVSQHVSLYGCRFADDFLSS